MATLENITENLQDTQENFEKLLAVALEYECWDEAKDIISNSHIADLAGFFNRSLSQQKIQMTAK
jgi:hypothetical protein